MDSNDLAEEGVTQLDPVEGDEPADCAETAADVDTLPDVPLATPEELTSVDRLAESSPTFALDDDPTQQPSERQAARVSVQSEVARQLQEYGRLTAQQAQQLEIEGRTRAELEDMLQRIERHFRNEQAIRRRADDAEAAAAEELAHERELRLRTEEELRTRTMEAQQTDALMAALQAEYLAVEQDKARIEEQLQEARNEAKRALSVLAKTEETVRQAEGMARLKLEAEHNASITRLTSELDSLREELNLRTRVVAREMARWRAQAEAAATAVRDAKDELMDRKRELDVTKERMDSLVEKLYIGRERGLELRGAIASTLDRLKAVESAKAGKREAMATSGGEVQQELAGKGGESNPDIDIRKSTAPPQSPSSGKTGPGAQTSRRPSSYVALNARRGPVGKKSAGAAAT